MESRVLIASSGFKESLSACEVAECIAAGLERVMPDARITRAPLVDGGEGFTEALVAATGGRLQEITVTGPVGQPVAAHYGFLGGEGHRTAVLEMASAAGLRLVPRDARDPLVTTTYGVGELIRAALDAGAERILVGCGDSGTNDGGAGAAEALGVKLLKADGSPIGHGGAALAEIDRVDLSGRDERLSGVTFDVACNIHNVLCGKQGVARIFGPQKGASPETVDQLEQGLERYAEVVERDAGRDVRFMPGGGASGGMGAGLHALLGATLHPRYDIILEYFKLDEALQAADLVLTAEGGINFQTPHGKIPAEVARRAKKYGLPVLAIVGSIGERAEINYEHGIDAMFSILAEPCTLEEAISDARPLLERCAENVMRAVVAGTRLGGGRAHGGGAKTDGQ
jgi:glycerate kinase